MPRISIITPTYNRAKLLTRAMDSVLAQSYEDFELLIIDDGSRDETQEIVERYKDVRLKCIRFEQNRGIGAARHEGVAQATGELVAFIDADDIWHPDKLASDLSILERHPGIDLLFDNYRNINAIEQTAQTGFDQTQPAFLRLKTNELESGVFSISVGIAEAMLTAYLIGTASVVTLRHSVFERVGNFNPALSGPEDFEFFWRAALMNVQFAYQTRVLVERHKDPSSITAHTCSFAPRLLKAYDLCEISMKSCGEEELLPSLNQARTRTWLSLIYAYALDGRRVEAWKAFRHSLRYGFAINAWIYLMAALAGPQTITFLSQYVHRHRQEKQSSK